jgi:hypothetical protein
MFFPRGWFTPVLPPTEESTWDMTVVGTCGSSRVRQAKDRQGMQDVR